MQEDGWRFVTPEDKDAPGEHVRKDPVEGHETYTHLRDIYALIGPEYKGRVSVWLMLAGELQLICALENYSWGTLGSCG